MWDVGYNAFLYMETRGQCTFRWGIILDCGVLITKTLPQGCNLVTIA